MRPTTTTPPPRPPAVFARLLFLLLACALGPAPLAAQSVLSATLTGQVTDAAGRPLSGVLITLDALGTGADRETETDNTGRYRFTLQPPGTYEIRAEAIGYQPLLARTLELSGGDDVRGPLSLSVATPPVVSVDTVRIRATSAGRIRPGGLRLGSADLDEIPHPLEDLSSVAGLSTLFDGSLGSQGLPGSMTVLFADGLPVYRARHPFRREEPLADAFFPRQLVSDVTALHNPTDAEWSGAAGGYATLGTRSGAGGTGASAEGAWTGDPLWSSSEIDFDDTPTLTSFQGAGHAAVDLKPDTMQLLVAAEGIRQETPVPARFTGDVANAFVGLDAELLASLVAPAVERIERYSGLARFYAQPSATSRVFLRGALAYSERSFDGEGPLSVGSFQGTGETSTEFSLASGFVSEYRPGVTLEIRTGVSRSDREFEPALPGLASAFVSSVALPLGDSPYTPAEVSRTDVVFLPMMRFDLEERGSLKLGLSGRLARHSFRTGLDGSTDFLFSDADALLEGEGLARRMSAEEDAFTTREIGAFFQYDLSPAPGLAIWFGGRLEHERLPSDEVEPNAEWIERTSLANDDYPESKTDVGGRVGVSWDPADDGRTRFWVVGSADYGDVDPAHLYEAFAGDGTTELTTYAGPGLDWVDGVLPAAATSLPTLTLLGPDTRPPRSLRATAGIVREVGAGLSIHVSGDFRRTDFLLRRRDLNLSVTPTAIDPFGRDVFGRLEKNGSLLSATGTEGRRFSEFGPVWALDPDGWSEYKAFTTGVEYRSEWVDLFGAYTRSETTDNWIGAASGSPWAELDPLLPSFVEDWADARSDFDVPNRATATALLRFPSLPGTTLSASYRYSSGRVYTPRYRRGIDANGDGSFDSDVPFVAQPEELGPLLESNDCLRNQAGGFAVRNSCTGPDRHGVDVRLRIGLGRIGGQRAGLFVDGLNLVETEDGLIDDALVLVDPDLPLVQATGGSRVRTPLRLNPDFGEIWIPTTRGRIVRIGLTIGG